MPITQYTGKTLLQKETIDRIQKEVNALLSNKDVAGAYLASQHVKRELSSLEKEEVAAVLPAYRSVSGTLKALALPVLSEEDVKGLLENNLEFLDTRSEPLLVSGLSAWLASQPDERQEEQKALLRSRVDPESPFAPGILSVLGARGQQPPASRAPVAPDHDGFFAPDELAEVSGGAQKAGRITRVPSVSDETDSISRTLFSFSGSRESEEAFAARARALVRSRLRDIRTAAQFADYAARPFAAGGLGLSGEPLSAAERIVKEAYGRLHGAPSAAAPRGESVSAPPNRRVAAAGGVERSSGPDAVPKAAPPSQGAPKTGKAQEELSALITKGTAGRAEEPSRRGPSPTTKPRLDDVTPMRPMREQPFAPRAMGLSDELGTVTLADFRSLGDPGAARQAILGKIATLGGESVAQKLTGMRSLRKSPLFQTYLAVGDSALSGGKKLSGALADPMANPEGMTEDEFFTIADLAGKLK